VGPDFYRALGIRSVINAAGHYTVYGGSVPSPRVRQAMSMAAASMVDMLQLQTAIHSEISRLTRNEAAYVTPGAAAGLYLSVAAAVAMHYKTRSEDLEPEVIRRSQVLMLAAGKNPYLASVRQVGIELVEVDGGPAALAAAITEDTVAVLHALVGQEEPEQTLRQCCALAHDAGLPLIVDAAAQIPPVRNLWEIPAVGADVVIFSGGKALGAPQSTGLLVGSAAFLGWMQTHGFPRHGFGRMFKVGRDQLVGLLAALEEVLERDEVAWLATREQQVRLFIEAFRGHPFYDVTRGFPNVAGQPVPYALVRPTSPELDVQAVVQQIREGDPSIVVGLIPGHSDHRQGFIVNTLALRDDEVDPVITALRAALDEHSIRNAQEAS
jgi:seryl-tRNA(Sec) selenium transferase